MDGRRDAFRDAALDSCFDPATLPCLLVLSTLLCVRRYCTSLSMRMSLAPQVTTCPSSVHTTTCVPTMSALIACVDE